MTFWVAGAAVGGALIGSRSTKKAVASQEKSAAEANEIARETRDKELALQEKMFNKNIELQQPAIDAGNTSRNRLMQLLGLSAGGADNGSAMRDFTMADFQADPGYQFRMSEGAKGLERSAAARGGLLSGGALKDMERFSQGLGSQEYGAAFDRFNTNKAAKMNPLLALADKSQVASGALGAAGQTYANGVGGALSQYSVTAGNNVTGAGNARASGYLAQGNQLMSLLNQGASGISRMSMPKAGGTQSVAPAGTYFDGYGYMPIGG